MKEIEVGNIRITDEMFTLIAGPCVIESEENVLYLAKEIKKICDKLSIPFIFKASFDKANRSSLNSFRGPGIKEGLRILRRVKEELKIPVTTDIHETYQAEIVAQVVDMIQIPAFLCRQTDLLLAAANTGKPINVKKAQFLSGKSMINVIKKIQHCENSNILLTERGNSFGYNNLVVDMTNIIDMKKFGFPVVFDATHSVQKPNLGETTGGNREYIEFLAKSAIATGANLIFMEVHDNPEIAKSDGPNMIKLNELEKLLIKLVKVYEAVKI